ncbi:MAG: ATP-binding protein [Bacteroidales bacterium]
MEDDVERAYLEYFENYTKRNWRAMLELFSDSFTMIGTGVDEYSYTLSDSLALFEREFRQALNPLQYKVKSIKVFPLCQDVAYLMALVDMSFVLPNGAFEYSNNRTTAILRKENGSWKVVHGHWSQPTDIQEEGESVPLSALMAQNKELKFEVISKQKELEEQNSQLLQMNEVKNKLFSIVSHDLKSPFSAFMGITDLMLNNFENDFEDKEYFHIRLQLLNEMSHNLFDLTENLLNWASLNVSDIKPKFRLVPIDAIVQKQINVLHPMWMKKGLRVCEDLPQELMVETDPDIVSIIVRNLLSNAIKFSFKKGVINVNVCINDGLLEITIADNGIGMTPQQVENVFVGYSSSRGTENEKGSGIGLVTCKEFVEKLNGQITVSSVPNKGTTFKVIIPV